MHHRYQGINYETASREGYRLCEEAIKTGNWHGIVDKLVDLRSIMNRRGSNERQEQSKEA